MSGLDKPNVSFIDKVGEAETLVLVLFGNGYHETKVGADKAVEGTVIALADALGQFHFFVYAEEFLTANFLKIFVE